MREGEGVRKRRREGYESEGGMCRVESIIIKYVLITYLLQVLVVSHTHTHTHLYFRVRINGKNAVPSFLRHHFSGEVRLANGHFSQFCVSHETKYIVITDIEGEPAEVMRYTESALLCKEGTGREGWKRSRDFTVVRRTK